MSIISRIISYQMRIGNWPQQDIPPEPSKKVSNKPIPLPTSAIEADIYYRGLPADVSQEELENIWTEENEMWRDE